MGTEVDTEVSRARSFLRDIRDAVARHPVASQCSEIALHERRVWGMTVLRLSGTLDGTSVELLVRVPDDNPAEPRLEYSRQLERIRSGRAMNLAASAFSAAHDEACRRHYPNSRSWKDTVRLALEDSFAALARGTLH